MSKKDYEMIADRLFLLVDANGENGTSRDIALLRQTVFELSSAFMADNVSEGHLRDIR